MIVSANAIAGYEFEYGGEPIARAKDILFDDSQWVVRYIEVDVGGWLDGRRVLLSPVSVADVDHERGVIQSRLTKAEIEKLPGIEADRPVSRVYEKTLYDHLGYGYYWLGGGFWGAGAAPAVLLEPVREPTADPVAVEAQEADPSLRLLSEVRGYSIDTRDDQLGELSDLYLDLDQWTVDYLLLDTRKWLPGRKVPLPVDRLLAFDWVERLLHVDTTRDVLKSAPLASDPPNADELASATTYFKQVPRSNGTLLTC